MSGMQGGCSFQCTKCFFCVNLWLFLCLFFGVSGKRTVAASAGSRRQYPGPHITLSHILHISCNILFMLCCTIVHVIFTLSHSLLKAPDFFCKEWEPPKSQFGFGQKNSAKGEGAPNSAYCFMKKKQSFLSQNSIFQRLGPILLFSVHL